MDLSGYRWYGRLRLRMTYSSSFSGHDTYGFVFPVNGYGDDFFDFLDESLIAQITYRQRFRLISDSHEPYNFKPIYLERQGYFADNRQFLAFSELIDGKYLMSRANTTFSGRIAWRKQHHCIALHRTLLLRSCESGSVLHPKQRNQ